MCFAKEVEILFSYVFDGKPPDLKKQELAKRYFCYHSIVSLHDMVNILQAQD